MLYIIISDDCADSLPLRSQARASHVQRLQDLNDQGRLVIAGPCPAVDSDAHPGAGFTGSLIIAEFASLECAEQWAAADPYIEAGVYKQTQVRPFKQVLPC